VRRAIQVLGIALMVAGLFLDTSMRKRSRRTGEPSGQDRTGRVPLVLFWVGAVLVVLSSIATA
jgi:heme/copper-type cytochrome/quinol oxidase subunit 2